MNDPGLERFYVYRSLNPDESWGAVICEGNLDKLPNIDFGMRVFAVNEKEAIARAKKEYDKIHAHDSDKENVRRFAAAALKHFILNESPEVAAKKSMSCAIALLEQYNTYFQGLKDEQEIFSDNAGTTREWEDDSCRKIA